MRAFCRPAQVSSSRPAIFLNRVTAVVLVAGMVCAVGCSGKSKRRWRYRSREEALAVALPSPEEMAASDADDRRGAVARLAEGGDFDHEDVFTVLDAVARTDPVTQIRCIAIRGLARYEDDRPIRTLLTVLQAKAGSQDALPANEDLRWEALSALVALEREGVLDGPQRDLARDVCLRLAGMGSSRNVRIVALDALGAFQDRVVLQPLIRALREKDYAIAERSENSLITLTGVTHQYDADAWEQWLANTENPFAHAGEQPDIPRNKPPSWFDKQKRAFRRALKLGNVD